MKIFVIICSFNWKCKVYNSSEANYMSCLSVMQEYINVFNNKISLGAKFLKSIHIFRNFHSIL